MHNRKIYPVITLFLCNALCFGNEYNIPVSARIPPNINLNHWRHDATNSTIKIDNIAIDVFQWRVATKNRQSVHIDIINENWEFAGWSDKGLDLPEVINISSVSIFRGTPTVYIRVTPWRENNGRIEVLTYGEIHISLAQVDFPITYNHPYLLNGENNSLQKIYSDKIQYLIICPSRFESAAKSLANMHSSEVIDSLQLITEVIVTDAISTDISGMAIRDYIIQRISDNLDPNGFLLLLGDEFDIPPIYDPNGDYPSDDFYSTNSTDIYSGGPQLISGRIPVSSDEDAWTVIEKIRDYTLNPTPGAWRSKIALVADDMHQSCYYNNSEASHTLSSDIIYDSLKTFLSIQPFYGLRYGLQQTSSGCEYPDLTADLMRTINNGVALINYIGHGSPESWAHEKIITKTRDLPLIQAENGKLAIWVAGTCSFGQYNGENSFMEDLLIKKNAAIAVIAATNVIGYDKNSKYIENLFGLSNSYGIEDFINGKINDRLGEIVANAKNINDIYNDYYRFHTFGDPALNLPFPKYSDQIINEPPLEIPIISEGHIHLNNASEYSTLLIRGIDKEIIYTYNTDNFTYTIPGNTYVQMNSSEIDICFRIPLDANVCDNCATIQVTQYNGNGWNGKIQTFTDISMSNSQTNFEDDFGPKIELYQDNNSVSDGSVLLTNLNLTITLNDTSGINLMETIGHGIQYKFDDNYITKVPGNEFVYESCDSGIVNIPVPITLSEGPHRFYLEAWDGVNNKSTVDINLNILGNSSQSSRFINKVFPIPNPFSEFTEFSMYALNPPTNITVTIYSIMGEKVIKLDTYLAEKSFISIPWDGKDQRGNKIANGTYFYHVKAEKKGVIIFEDIFKLSKVE